MKLYTRVGDDGRTALFGGQRTEKDALRVEAYGTLDELNSAIGLAAVVADAEHVGAVLAGLQASLFELGSAICVPPGERVKHVRPIGDAHVRELEQAIDMACEALPPMRHFILPGGCEAAARLHVARTICRRAERQLVGLHRQEPLEGPILPYMNRLSDLLFALARRANQLAGVADVAWKPEGT